VSDTRDDSTARRQILVASNRGPVSFSRGDDGRLSVKRGGGGVVSGLSSVASHEDLLWVCAALTDGDRVAARTAPGGMLGLDGTLGGSAVRMLDIPTGTFNRAYNTIANSVLRLLRPPGRVAGGSIRFRGEDITAMSPEQLRRFRWRNVSMVFQSAMNALNPVMRVGDQFVDMMRAHEKIGKKDALAQAAEILEFVGIDRERVRSYPHELSGGMRQRVIIAMALSLNPEPPDWYWFPFFVWHLDRGEFDAALDMALRCQSEKFFWTHAMHAMAYSALDMSEEAAAAVERLLEAYPDFPRMAREELAHWGSRPERRQRVLDALWRAGVPMVESPSAPTRMRASG